MGVPGPLATTKEFHVPLCVLGFTWALGKYKLCRQALQANPLTAEPSP